MGKVKNTGAGGFPAVNKPVGFWDKKSAVYPRYNTDENSYEARVLGLIKSAGVDFAGKSVLDIGCGSGMLTIKIALLADRVTALDISPGMLEVLSADAEAHDVRNIERVCADFAKYVPETRHDIVFCSMTPAVADEAGKKKLLSLEGATVVFTGTRESARSNVMNPLFEERGVVPYPLKTAIAMKNILDFEGISHETVPLEGTWRVGFEREKLEFAVRSTMEGHGIELDDGFLREYLEKFKGDDGRWWEVTDYFLEIVIWKNP
ncbi:MAG: class I SAM-dependent methyltransferase [Deltaproteobacteria bacterium]|jgi:SAM-dependent methyltransferase|nr:class I SAM-dependent methyltransferase [Deltaproteobacteria bacterium]